MSDFRLIPPPMMIRSGAVSRSMCSRYSSTRSAHFSQLRSCSSLARSEARCSASLPRISMCPNSVLGTSTPCRNSALPIPVPNVSISTVPCCPTPAPNDISARPAASASLISAVVSPVAWLNRARVSSPTQAGSRLAAVCVTPSTTTPGNVTPAGPDQLNASTSWATVLATASGMAGCGVSSLTRSASSWP